VNRQTLAAENDLLALSVHCILVSTDLITLLSSVYLDNFLSHWTKKYFPAKLCKFIYCIATNLHKI